MYIGGRRKQKWAGLLILQQAAVAPVEYTLLHNVYDDLTTQIYLRQGTITRRTLVWKGVSIAFFAVRLDISATVAPIGVKLYMVVHIGLEQKVFHFSVSAPGIIKIPNFGHLTTNILIVAELHVH